MKRTVISLMLALAMVFSLVLVVAPQAQAAEHQDHCVCGGKWTGSAEYHTCATVTGWTPLSNDDLALSPALMEGNYYLTEDITLVSPLTVMDGNVVLCLNGFDLNGNPEMTGNDGQVLRQTLFSGSLTLTDCAAEEGTITSGNISSTGGVFFIKDQPEFVFNIYAGNIKGSSVNAAGGTLRLQTGVVNMYGGVISGGKSATYGGNMAVYATFNMYGGVIKNGTAEQRCGNLYIGGNGIANLYGGMIYGGTCPQNADVWLFQGADTHGTLTIYNMDSSFDLYYDAETYLDLTKMDTSLTFANKAIQTTVEVVKAGFVAPTEPSEPTEPTEPSVEPTEEPTQAPAQDPTEAPAGDNAGQEQPASPILWIVIGVAAVAVVVVVIIVLKKKKA